MVASVSSGNSSVSNWADSIFSKLDSKKQGFIEKSDFEGALSVASDGKAAPASTDDVFGALDGDSDGRVTKSELTEAITKLGDQLNAQFDVSRTTQGGMPSGRMPPPDDVPAPEESDAHGQIQASGTSTIASTGGAAPPAMHGPRGPHGGHDGPNSSAIDSNTTDDAASTYNAAMDTDGDGTVSADELQAYRNSAGASSEGNTNTALNSLVGSTLATLPSADNVNANATSSHTGSVANLAPGHSRQRDPMRDMAHALELLKAYADGATESSTSVSTSSSTNGAVSVVA